MSANKTITEARQRIHRYCAYQERCHLEVRIKLFSFGLRNDQVNELISELIEGGFLNEERFARLYAGGKFRMKHWGRVKIANGLRKKGLNEKCTLLGLSEIDEPVYLQTLHEVLKEKLETQEATDKYILRNKVSRFAIGKGFESDLVWQELKRLLPD